MSRRWFICMEIIVLYKNAQHNVIMMRILNMWVLESYARAVN